MKRQSLYLGAVICTVVLSGCGGGSDGNGSSGTGGGVNPDAPDDVSRVLFIPDATRESGTPPAPTASADSPILQVSEPGNSNLPAVAGASPVLNLDLNSRAGYDQCYVQVVGAQDYLLIDTPQGQGAQSGALQIPLQFDAGSNFSTGGSFCVDVSVRDQNGFISNAVTQCFDALPTSTVQNATACVDDYPEGACQLLLGDTSGFDQEFLDRFPDIAEGINQLRDLNFSGSFVRNQSCASVAPRAQQRIELEGFNCSGACGACFFASPRGAQ